MKKIHDLWKMLYGMLLFLAVSCSTPLDDNSEGLLSGTATGGDVAEGTRQLQIEVRNKLVTAGAATRKSGSIALNTENEITAMDFYVFASDDEFGTYTFQEKLSYRAGHEGDKIEGATPFILVTNSNNNAFSSAQLTIKKGLYVRLYCVANATQLYVLNEKKDPKVYEPATLEPLQMELDGNQMKIKVPGTSEEDFLSKFTVRPLDPTNLDDIIKTPLLMTGSMAGCINLTDYTDNAVINTSLKLTRGVVRFDVRNTASQSNLTIESVSMTQGNATTALFPLDARPAADGSLITYPQKLFPGGVNEPINQGLQEAAFYSYATPDQACLVLTGTYSTPGQEPVAVKYEVPFNNLQDGEGQHISLQPNHRYTVNINEADPYEVKFAITVADWENGESLDDYDPADANKLHFAAINLNDNVANSVKNSKHTVRTYNANTAGVNQGTITFYSNSDAKVRVTYANGDGKIDGGQGVLGNTGDRKVIGNETPRYNFGLTLNAEYKGFDFRIFFQGTLKRDKWLTGLNMWGADGGYWQSTCLKENMDYFRPADTDSYFGPNVNGYLPRPLLGASANNNKQVNSQYLQDASYMRCKNIQLGYTFPKQWISNWGLQNMRMFVSAENLFVITGLKAGAYDPEVLDGYAAGSGKAAPLKTAISFGLNVSL